MITRKELESAIAECERSPVNYQSCEKLATFYTIYDHLYKKAEPLVEVKGETTVGDYGDTEFLTAIRGKKSEEVWALMDETMSTIQITNPALYNGIMRRL